MSTLTLIAENGVQDSVPFNGKNVDSRTWRYADVEGGKWALYSEDIEVTNNAQSVVLDTDGRHDLNILGIDFSPKYARGLDYEPRGLLLFQHAHYVGKQKLYTTGSDDVNDEFPAGSFYGVSSAITWEGSAWGLYENKNHVSPFQKLEKNEKCYFLAEGAGVGNDKTQSVKPL